MIEETIRRNASPVRLDETAAGVVGAGSCSSLASSGSDEVLTKVNRSSGITQTTASAAQQPFGKKHIEQKSSFFYLQLKSVRKP